MAVMLKEKIDELIEFIKCCIDNNTQAFEKKLNESNYNKFRMKLNQDNKFDVLTCAIGTVEKEKENTKNIILCIIRYFDYKELNYTFKIDGDVKIPLFDAMIKEQFLLAYSLMRMGANTNYVNNEGKVDIVKILKFLENFDNENLDKNIESFIIMLIESKNGEMLKRVLNYKLKDKNFIYIIKFLTCFKYRIPLTNNQIYELKYGEKTDINLTEKIYNRTFNYEKFNCEYKNIDKKVDSYDYPTISILIKYAKRSSTNSSKIWIIEMLLKFLKMSENVVKNISFYNLLLFYAENKKYSFIDCILKSLFFSYNGNYYINYDTILLKIIDSMDKNHLHNKYFENIIETIVNEYPDDTVKFDYYKFIIVIVIHSEIFVSSRIVYAILGSVQIGFVAYMAEDLDPNPFIMFMFILIIVRIYFGSFLQIDII
ncbi:hypothetical protein BCR36DRAFT_416412 [Piromyces finnis]|uniref:Uncharacterized protein n=1 Tax=Piromyces finnis TaxID=1754191 RepID=A0A1Y1UXI9_9FUNG|nr:hypothetical protein BCR36DRAFT_416412 [Piromyces finnis]|eukprot:ORX41947.1 hypothetical protein BCR36DRAFT_416412 [Piromyces finnis]